MEGGGMRWREEVDRDVTCSAASAFSFSSHSSFLSEWSSLNSSFSWFLSSMICVLCVRERERGGGGGNRRY